MDHPRGTPRSLFGCLPFLLVRSTDLPWISAEVSIFRPPDDKPSHIMSLEVMSYCCIKCLVFLSSLGTDNSPTYPLDGDPHLLLRQVHRCNICLLRIQVISLCERLAGQDAKVTTVPVGVLKTTRLLTRLFQWTTDVADRLAFSEVSLYVNL